MSTPSSISTTPALDSSPYLDPVEISPPDRKRLSEIAFRHSGWARERARVEQALHDDSVPAGRLLRFQNCGAYAWVLRNRADPTVLRISASHCHDRMCKPCQRARANALVHSVMSHVPRSRLRFITLTIRHNRLPLALQLQKLTIAFRTLRRTALWRRATQGGIAFIETKRSSDNSFWHPHLHVIHEGGYIPHRALANTWRRLTRDSFVVHLRTVTQPQTVAKYLTTYANKPYDSTITHHPTLLIEVIRAFRNRRTVFTFGTWRHLALRGTTYSPDEWQAIRPLFEILSLASIGDPDAVAILAALRRNVPCLTENHDQYPKPPPNQPYSA